MYINKYIIKISISEELKSETLKDIAQKNIGNITADGMLMGIMS
jgi:hypothetical protein